MDKWEYKIEIASMDTEFLTFEYLLNYEGENGWELVTIVERSDEFRCIFKRKKKFNKKKNE